jgi:hypothetical protein
LASVMLDFVKPEEPDLVKLEIYESASKDGPLALIESLDETEIGTYPDYITRWTTQNATSELNWFAIRWMNSGGAYSDYSPRVQGGTETAVAEVTARIQQRDPMISESIAFQEASAVVFEYFSSVDVPLSQVNPSQLSGLTMLALARTYVTSITTSSTSADQWTAGLVSLKSGTSGSSQTVKNIDALMKQAAMLLGVSYSRVCQMIPYPLPGSWGEIQSWDTSRLLIEVE